MLERASQLCRALRRINASPDLGTVLRAVVDGARALTGTRYGVIAALDDTGQLRDCVTSGLTAEEHQQLVAMPDGPRLFEHLRDLPGPWVLKDLPDYARSAGLSCHRLPCKVVHGTQMRYQGTPVGSFLLCEKEGGGEFTTDDEEVLVLFASQAATAIANARILGSERRARADMEALIEIAPVGVVVFQARTGHIESANREAERIVNSLRQPAGTMEELLETMTVRRADGREVALSEIPLARVLSGAEPARGEEIVLSVPDGRSVTTLVNATPIHSADGEVESVVVTIQDLAALEELERARSEFVGLVSHELRSPLTAIKGSCVTVLGASPSPERAEMLQFFRIIDAQADHMHSLISDLLDTGRIESGTLSVTPQPENVAGLIDQARNTFVSGRGKHVVHVDLPRDLPRVLADEQRVVQVLNNLLSNAARHSPSSSPIRITAVRGDVHVAISVSDQGAGVPPDQLAHLFRKHAGVAGGGRKRGMEAQGLGLTICQGLVDAHGGRIWAERGPEGRGARFTFTLPVATGTGGGANAGSADQASKSREGTRILVVDDDPETLRHVRGALAAAGYEPLVTGDPRELPNLIRTKKPRLVVLDLMLPETDGIELLERLPELAHLPVIFISGYKRDETIVRAFELGAVDYIVKPFSHSELTARIQAALRRHSEPEAFLLGDLSIHYAQRRVTLAGRPVRLTATEYELLRVLSAHAGRVLTHDSLLHEAWSGRGTEDWRTVRAYVTKLRRKLGDDPANPRYIQTERGIGYRMPLRYGE